MMNEVQGERGSLAHIRCLLTMAWDWGQEETVGGAETLEAGGGCGLERGGGGCGLERGVGGCGLERGVGGCGLLLGGRGLVFGRAPLYLSVSDWSSAISIISKVSRL